MLLYGAIHECMEFSEIKCSLRFWILEWAEDFDEYIRIQANTRDCFGLVTLCAIHTIIYIHCDYFRTVVNYCITIVDVLIIRSI